MAFFRKKQRAPNPYPTPPWLKWLIALFVLYTIVVATRDPPAPGGSVENNTSLASRLGGLADFKGYGAKLFPDSTLLRIKEKKEGGGEPAVCGQDVKILYSVYASDEKTLLLGNRDSGVPLSFRLGKGEGIPALEHGVVGMRVGGARALASPPSLAYGAPGFASDAVPANATVVIVMELVELSPSSPLAQKPPAADGTPALGFRFYDTHSGGQRVGNCGERVRAHVQAWRLDGTRLFTTVGGAPLSFTTGESEVPFALEYGVQGMPANGLRTLLVPPGYMQPLRPGAPSALRESLTAPEGEFILLDIDALTEEPAPSTSKSTVTPTPDEEKREQTPSDAGQPDGQ